MRIGIGRAGWKRVVAMAAAGVVFAFPDVSPSQEMEPIPTETGPSLGALTIRRNATESELQELARTMADARARAAELEKSIAGIERTTAGLREALGLTAVLVTHDLREALELGTRVAVMRSGRVEQEATADALLESPATPYVSSLLQRAGVVRAS